MQITVNLPPLYFNFVQNVKVVHQNKEYNVELDLADGGEGTIDWEESAINILEHGLDKDTIIEITKEVIKYLDKATVKLEFNK